MDIKAQAARCVLIGTVGVGVLSACHPHLVVPELGAAVGPLYPPPPEQSRVAYVGQLGGPAEGMGYPIDVACGPDHQLAVADPGRRVVWVIDLDSGRFDQVSQAGLLPLESPVGVAYQDDGSLLIVDSVLATVFRDAPGRKGPRVISQGPPMKRPVAVTALDDGGFLLVDAGAHGLFRNLPGQGLVQLGTGRGVAGQGFNFPVDVATGSDGAAYVCDSLNGVISRVMDGQITPVAGGLGAGGGGLVRPKGLAIQADGTMHVVDGGMQHVQVYSAGGDHLGSYGQPGDDPGSLGLPSGICLDDDGHAFVADPVHKRVQIYELLWLRD